MKILSYNIACLPRLFNFFGKPCDRIEKLNRHISKQRPDIFCLQEVFSYGTLKSIKEFFGDKYYIYSYNDTYIRLDSGLLIASKYPITKKKAHIFKHSYGEDKLSHKGVLVVDIVINNKKYSILNTHLNADPIFGFKKKAIDIRDKQIKQMRSIVKRKKLNNINNIIICGDFNIDYNDLSVIKPLLNIYRYNTINQQKIVTFSEEKAQLDYIIILNQVKSKNKPKYKRFINTRLSDHYMLGLDV
tara:strand:+ start:347 stop:1078 length:732 start_codon:yes stop_codon:yes gene_type:complete